MKILVTGGAGFIGSAVVRRLLHGNTHELLNLDKLTYAANLDNLKEALPSERYEFAQADIADARSVKQIIGAFDPDAILHLAAETHVDRSIDGAAQFVATNINGTHVLLDAALGHWRALSPARKSAFRLVHISTDEVFGSLGTSGAFTEDTPYAPNSPYSASKAASDMLARAWHRTYGLPVIISNCSNNYGPYQFPEKLIPVVVLAALEGRPIPVYGKGANVRDWLYVDDHVEALLAILSHGRPGESYAIGGHNEISNIDLVRLLCRLMDEFHPEGAPHDRLISFVTDRPGHDLRYAIDSAKITRETGWRPGMSVEQGMRRTVRWYLDNRWWWEAIRARGFKAGRLGLGK